MAGFGISLDLSKLQQVALKDVKGKTGDVQCVIIPVKANNIFVSEKGGIYMSLSASETQVAKYGQTHFIKNSVPKEKFRTMSKEEKRALPIVGNMKPYNYSSDNASHEEHETSSQNVAPKNESVDDLPF